MFPKRKMKPVLSELSQGRNVQLKIKGNSMAPLYKDGEVVLISPIDTQILKIGDVVLVRVTTKSKFLTHQILSIEESESKYMISNAAGKIDGIVDQNIYGLLSKAYPNFQGLTYKIRRKTKMKEKEKRQEKKNGKENLSISIKLIRRLISTY